jgi:NADH dehydrogenase
MDHSPIPLPDPRELPRIVVIGAGFGGLSFLRKVDPSRFQTILIDRNNFHQFQPLFYQVAMSALEPDSIVFPVRKQIGKKPNSYFLYDEVERIDPEEKRVVTEQGWLSYDRLIIASGASPTFFGMKEVQANALTMKDVRGALGIRHFMLESLEKAAVARDETSRDLYTNFLIVGGGPTGVELAGALAEFKRYILPKDYPEFASSFMRIYLLEAGDRLLAGMSEKASASALKHLRNMGVDVRLNEAVEGYDGRFARTSQGAELLGRTFIWTAGVQGSFPEGISEEHVVKGNRLGVDEKLRVKGCESIYAIGDAAALCSEAYPYGHPQLAQPAMQQGAYLARSFRNEKKGNSVAPFEYKDKGVLATIGKRKAVADIGRSSFDGYLAWLIWSLVHLMQISGFRNKFMVGLNWAWSYFSYEKGDRLIIRRYRDS